MKAKILDRFYRCRGKIRRMKSKIFFMFRERKIKSIEKYKYFQKIQTLCGVASIDPPFCFLSRKKIKDALRLWEKIHDNKSFHDWFYECVEPEKENEYRLEFHSPYVFVVDKNNFYHHSIDEFENYTFFHYAIWQTKKYNLKDWAWCLD